MNLNESVKGGVEAAKQVFELAKVLKENKGDDLFKQIVPHISSLLDVLNSPLGQLTSTTLPFLPLVTGLISYTVDKNKKELTLEDCIILVSQTAYLESLQGFLRTQLSLIRTLNPDPASEATANKIKNLGQTLELSREEAEQTLICFHESPLAKQFNTLLKARFIESGLDERNATIITERISRKTHRYLKPTFAKIRHKVPTLAPIYGDGWEQDLKFYSSIDNYLTDKIAKEPLESVFTEEFTFNDVYVPSKIQAVIDGKVQEEQTAQNIEDWAINLLLDESKPGKVLFIQGGPGRGKSVFCRMFADKVRQDLYPIYTPILICLRELKSQENNFDKTLQAAIGTEFTNYDGWLTERNTRFLFLLDGFDELLLQQGKTESLRFFLDQVAIFQKRCQENAERGHRIIITGRPLALYGIERLMPDNLDWVNITLMDDETQVNWLDKWEKIVGKDERENFYNWLHNERCPETVQTLAREPLLLYLLGAMYRDKSLSVEAFSNGETDEVKVKIYQSAVDWVLTRQRSKKLNLELTELEKDDLYSVLIEAGLCVIQSENETALIRTIEDRLVAKGDKEAKELIEKARENKKENPLKNAFAAFYLQAATKSENSIEFFHKSFAEFFAAECLAETMIQWTEKGGRRKETYVIKDQDFAWQMYDLLGYGHLTSEIISYLMPLLKQQELNWTVLYERLYDFYLRWSQGEFIEALDSSEDILPLKKARQLQKNDIKRGQRQVDIYTGLNGLILLLEINRYAQTQEQLKELIHFYPCGNPDNETEVDEYRLFKIIGYSECLGVDTFNDKVGEFLSYADLSNAYLSNAYLSNADFSNANLSNANLSNAYFFYANLSNSNLSKAYLLYADLRYADLIKANLFNANLSNTNLSDANLSNADLSNADLSNANLSYADLRNANLSYADLSNANLKNANFSNIKWDENTQWEGVIGLETVTGMSDELREYLRSKGLIS